MRLFERNILFIETFALSPLIPELYWFSWVSLLEYFLIMIHGPSSLFIGRSLMWADFQVYIKDASFREEHFCHWNFRSISSHSWVVLILVRKPLEYFLIMIHGPSSLFIGRLVDVSWFSSLYKRCVLSRGTFLSLKLRSISSHSWVVLILVRKPLEYFLIMIHGPSSLFIGRLVDASWFSSLYKNCVFSRGTFLSLKLSLYLLSFLSCIDSREKAFGVFFDYDPWCF